MDFYSVDIFTNAACAIIVQNTETKNDETIDSDSASR